MTITIYTTRICPYCNAAKELLRRKGVSYREIDVSDDAELDALIRRTGWKTVPQIFIGDRMIGGFSELSTLESEGKLDALLKV
jgi:glutaredoxin 3